MKAKCKTKTAPMKPERKNEIVVYQPDEVMRLEVRVLDESVWLIQAQIAELFGTKRPAITPTFHVRLDGELFSRRNAA